jgi:matrixin
MIRPLRPLAALAAVALGLPLLWTGSASAHFQGFDSVVSKKIDYIDHTIFDDARGWARDRWEDAGVVDIKLDTGWTNADVEYRDTNNGAVIWDGLYTNQPGDDTITFNRAWMDGYTTAQRRHVALHETGHALGLDHSFSGQVMSGINQALQYLGSHDHADYDDLWG